MFWLTASCGPFPPGRCCRATCYDLLGQCLNERTSSHLPPQWQWLITRTVVARFRHNATGRATYNTVSVITPTLPEPLTVIVFIPVVFKTRPLKV